jgi:hypothetical protein
MTTKQSILFLNRDGHLSRIAPNADMMRPAVTGRRLASVQPELPPAVEGEPTMLVFENVVVMPAETEQDFVARTAAEVVPAGCQFLIVDTASLPDGSPDHWSVDWATGKVTPNAALATADADTARRAAIQTSYDAAIRSGLGDANKQGSMSRYHDGINSRMRDPGYTPSSDETAAIGMFDSIDSWEAAMIAARELALATPTTTAVEWPAPPSGLAAFLTQY